MSRHFGRPPHNPHDQPAIFAALVVTAMVVLVLISAIGYLLAIALHYVLGT